MPAEAPQQGEPMAATEVVDPVVRFMGLDVVAPDLPLADGGLDGDRARFLVW